MAEQKIFKVVKCPSESFSYTNCAVVNPLDFPTYKENPRSHIQLTPGPLVWTGSGSGPPPKTYIFPILPDVQVDPGTVGLNLQQRKFSYSSIGQEAHVSVFEFTAEMQCQSMVLQVDFLTKAQSTGEPYDVEELARVFLSQFPFHGFHKGMPLTFNFLERKIFRLTVKEMMMQPQNGNQNEHGTSQAKVNSTCSGELGIIVPGTKVVFEKGMTFGVNLKGGGRSQYGASRQPIINPEWDFQKIGIGGMDREFSAIFRRAFASRVFPPEVVELLGFKHVKGILLHGPPGTGKTLMARQIGKMLNAKGLKVVNGPEILDKYVGQSEANVRALFAEAEEEEKKLGPNSGLHIIIFDEIDAICKQRGSVGGGTGVHDTVVNQLLSKIDGVEQLNNILVIGMTNRRDMIDEALLRPGRLEVQMEISLPDELGRLDILKIHTTLMREHGKLAEDVELKELAVLTKNFSGAELEGLIRAAQSTAMNRLVKAASKVEVDSDAMEKLTISRSDFLHALENDVKPAFGASAETIDLCLGQGFINWGPPVADMMEDGMLFVQQALNSTNGGLVSVLIEGPPNTGKTALAANLVKNSDFPFVKLCTPEDMVGFSESAKCYHIKRIFEDAYKSPLSCIVVDNIERLLDFSPVGPRYSNLTLQALLVLLKKQPPLGRRLLVLCTSSKQSVLEDLDMLSAFMGIVRVPNINEADHVITVLEDSFLFTPEEILVIRREIEGRRLYIGIKKLLALIDLVRQTPEEARVRKFLEKLKLESPYAFE